MTNNIHDFPGQKPPDFIVGPFEEYRIVIEGRCIPNLTGRRHDDGRVQLILDGRLSATFSEADAYQAAWLIANAMAIGAGYPSLQAESKDRPFASKAFELSPPPR